MPHSSGPQLPDRGPVTVRGPFGTRPRRKNEPLLFISFDFFSGKMFYFENIVSLLAHFRHPPFFFPAKYCPTQNRSVRRERFGTAAVFTTFNYIFILIILQNGPFQNN